MTATEHGMATARETAPALQVIVLGSGGGPIEHNTTALLVRSVASGWHRGSIIAVDAGVHLGAIARVLESTQPKGLGTDIPLPHVLTSGPFTGLEVQSSCPNTNAAYITQSLIDTYLITHPHLDHISGFVVNTAGFPGTRPKRLAGQPSTIHAFKTHIFNNVIWPNLSDENNGAGLVTYMRLVEGGSPALGEGEEKGYVEISDGLAVKCGASLLNASAVTAATPQNLGSDPTARLCVYDSSAYFVRDVVTGNEVLIFGDVEPDSVSLSPRNLRVWREAAPKIAAGTLSGVFIEKRKRSIGHPGRERDGEAPSDVAEAGLTVRRKVYEEPISPKSLRPLPPSAISAAHRPDINGVDNVDNGSTSLAPGSQRMATPSPDISGDDNDRCNNRGHDHGDHGDHGDHDDHDDRPNGHAAAPAGESKALPLQGLRVVIIHVKDKLLDGFVPGERILKELREEEEIEKLGCEFIISSVGQSLFF
ncbi:unnamed protein product [Parascedosporium putredinis]|uniref:3',5'-cyclic-nucleotide phosphodiesterase n=1 Tax=Parascedosporium putredinis TaxID=1442378 RepID=A0A9P1H6Y2_9PEZI|nr:unnamed protein product [Parascedosporium putredinis]CAI8000888.1 unnamed protein product [Parascedosporium putredinis]